MRYVVDTSAWIEWVINSPTAAQLAPIFPGLAACVVPTLVQHELAKWFARERGDDYAGRIIAHTMLCDVAVLDTDVALVAAEVGRANGLATADAIVYATALRHGSGLLTCDAHFQGLPHVTYVPKQRLN